MKIFLQPTTEPLKVTLTLDVRHIEDVIDIKPFELTYEIKNRDTYIDFIFEAQVHLTLACAKTLKPVSYDMSLQSTIVFGHIDEADFEWTREIDINLFVLGEIMSLKPVAVYHQDAKEMTFEKEKNPSPFEALLKD